MQCLILAGGLGTRIQHLAKNLPKALLPIGHTPFLILQLQWLKKMGITEVILCLAHKADEILESIQLHSYFDLPSIKYSMDGAQLRGTGGAILNAEKWLQEDFLVTYGDSFLIYSPLLLWEKHQNENFPATLSIFKNDNKGDQSNVSVINEHQIIYQKSAPHPEMDYIDYGMMALQKKDFINFALKKTNENKLLKFDVSEYLEFLSVHKKLNFHEAEVPFFEIGSELGYIELNHYFKKYEYDLNRLYQHFFSSTAQTHTSH